MTVDTVSYRAFRSGRAFVSILRRDLYVTGRDIPSFAAQVILQPLFLLFVFGKVLTDLGYAQAGYAELLFPGTVALTAVLTGLQGTALPLMVEFAYTREIEDRLLAPLPIRLVAVEKLVFSTLRALLAAAAMFPLGVLVLGSIPWTGHGAALAIVVLVLAAAVGSTMGLALGTLATGNRVSVIFTLAITPLLFTGCSQFPWLSLARLRWFQIITAFNPLTYASEGMRAALDPGVPHISAWICLLALFGFLALFVVLGLWGFNRRALD
jgi:ABC-2 type transport system permease protein